MSDTSVDSTPLTPARVERRENCPRYEFAGGVWIILADSSHTAGHIANLESVYARGGGLPLLLRQREAEFAYVIAGRVGVTIGDQPETVAKPGALIYVPSGVRRRLVAQLDDTRIYYGLVPAGSEALIRQLGKPTLKFEVPYTAQPLDAVVAAQFGMMLNPD